MAQCDCVTDTTPLDIVGGANGTSDSVKYAVISEIIAQGHANNLSDEQIRNLLTIAFMESSFNPSAGAGGTYQGIGQLNTDAIEEALYRHYNSQRGEGEHSTM